MENYLRERLVNLQRVMTEASGWLHGETWNPTEASESMTHALVVIADILQEEGEENESV